MPKLKEFSIGDEVEYYDGKKSKVTCIHKDRLFLDRDTHGKSCIEHKGQWECLINENGEVGNDHSCGTLKLIHSAKSPYKFKKGDRVVSLQSDVRSNMIGFHGTVIENSFNPCVAWDEKVAHGYSALGYDNVWALAEENLALIEETTAPIEEATLGRFSFGLAEATKEAGLATLSRGMWQYAGSIIKTGTTYLPTTSIDNSIKPTGKTFMANVLEFFKNITATADEKLLQEFYIEDPIGTPTEVGFELSHQITYKANREAIIAIAKQMKEEQDAKRKK